MIFAGYYGSKEYFSKAKIDKMALSYFYHPDFTVSSMTIDMLSTGQYDVIAGGALVISVTSSETTTPVTFSTIVTNYDLAESDTFSIYPYIETEEFTNLVELSSYEKSTSLT